MRVAVVVKQVPQFESLALGPDGRLVRAGMSVEMNPYCRRAVSQGVDLAQRTDGRCTVFTLGPPEAADVLREAIAWGADDGVLISDPAFAGSDTLATARALAAAISREDRFDLILAGRNSVDADTGQVGPELAQMLGLAFVGGARTLSIDTDSGRAAVRAELDDGWAEVEVDLPAVISCAERLCQPAKVDAGGRASVDQSRLRLVTAADLGPGPWGQLASPTRVGQVRVLEVDRQRLVLAGTVAQQVAAAVEVLRDAGALPQRADRPSVGLAVSPAGANAEAVADHWPRGDLAVAVLVEPDRHRMTRELLSGAARVAAAIRGRVVALAPAGAIDPVAAGTWGADELIVLAGSDVAEDVAGSIGEWSGQVAPWAFLAPGTMWGREVAARLAAQLGAGLTGDAVDLAVEGDRLVGWKPAFGGRLVVAITATSPVQLITVRAGMLAALVPRTARPVATVERRVVPAGRVRIMTDGRDDDMDDLATAARVVGVGAGVKYDEYAELNPLLEALGAQLAATRKVTDLGWQPRARQIGLTGRSISPTLYIAIGLSGKFNHLVGVRGAGMIVAINDDPRAAVFGQADVGIVSDWHQAVPLLAKSVGS